MLGYATLSEMVAEAQSLLCDDSVTTTTDLKASINRNYDAVSSLFPWNELLRADETGLRQADQASLTTLIASEAEAPLPAFSGRLHALYHQTVSAEPLMVVNTNELYRRANVQLNQTGTPCYAAVIGSTSQIRRLSAAGALTAYNTVSTSGDGSLTVRVEYRPSTGVTGQDAVATLSGTWSSGVAMPSSVAAGYGITKVTLPTGWIGNFVIQDGSSNQIVNIPAVDQTASAQQSPSRTITHPLIRVWPVPSANMALTVVWQARPRRLVADSDAPEIPVATYLVEAALAELLRHYGKRSEASTHQQEAASFLRQISATFRQGPSVIRPRYGNFISQNR